MSFLTYLLSRFADDIRPHQDRIAGSVVDLLVTCPDSVPVRRELLVATRSYLASEFRKSFFAYVPTLLQENVLVSGFPWAARVGAGRGKLGTEEYIWFSAHYG